MVNKSGVVEQIVSLPKGGGALKGLGEKFRPDLHTGTGNFSFPIELPEGRNGFQPQLSFKYSTGNGNGPYGLGWNLTIPNVTRKTSKGIPKYIDNAKEPEEWDTFILSGAEDLVPVILWKFDVDISNPLIKIINPKKEDFKTAPVIQFRPRTESLFAKILWIRKTPDGRNYWEVISRDGTRSIYGYTEESKIFDEENPKHIFKWLLFQTEDQNGNKILYHYKKEDRKGLENKIFEVNHNYNQTYLRSIEYVNYKDPHNEHQEKYLFRIDFDYGEFDEEGDYSGIWDYRNDSFSFHKAGFEIRTIRYCKSILIKIQEEGKAPSLIKSYTLDYNYGDYNNVLLLKSVRLKGFRLKEVGDQIGDVLEDGTEIAKKYRVKTFPPLEFGYTSFNPQKRVYNTFTVKGDYLPERGLTNPEYELIDISGYGLPGILHTTITNHRYWKNLGNCHFSYPHQLHKIPAGVSLADDAVFFADMEGNGRTDLLITKEPLSGYYPTNFDECWDPNSFQLYKHTLSFDMNNPNVKLVDMVGNGIIDILYTNTPHFEIYYNKGKEGWDTNIHHIPRKSIEVFPNVFFGDPRRCVRLADMSGDGMQDIVVIHNGKTEYWPHMGYGNYGKQIILRNSPNLGYSFDPKRILLSDIDGDGFCDMIYIDFDKITVFINQSGNSWSEAIIINGTPPISDMDSIRAVDFLGIGTAGILWSFDYGVYPGSNYKFLDLTGGIKPYLLDEMSNNIGATTRVQYTSSTKFYLEDEKRHLENPKMNYRWKTHLPFPVQCLEKVEVVDHISNNKMVSRYRYHHGYWDGEEREFRGFGMVEQYDTDTIKDYKEINLHEDNNNLEINEEYYSSPILTKTWFHQGIINNESTKYNFGEEYWEGDSNNSVINLINIQDFAGKKEAYRSIRGNILRIEVYALDSPHNQELGHPDLSNKPYTVTKNKFEIREENDNSPLGKSLLADKKVVYPYQSENCFTQWDRGDNPMMNITIFSKPDFYGRQNKEKKIGKSKDDSDDTSLVRETITNYATLDLPPLLFQLLKEYKLFYLIDIVSEIIVKDNNEKILKHTQKFYDGENDFCGLDLGEVSKGNLVRTQNLAFKKSFIDSTFFETPIVLGGISHNLKSENIPSHHYTVVEKLNPQHNEYWVQTIRYLYKTHYGNLEKRKDPNNNDTYIEYDLYDYYPIKINYTADLFESFIYDYEALSISKHIDLNQNETEYTFDALGMVKKIAIKGKKNNNKWQGDTLEKPTIFYEYNIKSYIRDKEPISFRTIRRERHTKEQTIESIEYFDGLGRSIQHLIEAESDNPGQTKWRVEGWQVYNNKGWIVEKYDSIFSNSSQFQKRNSDHENKIQIFYDPLGRIIKVINPNGSFQQIFYGKIEEEFIDQPSKGFKPNPWMAFHYDENDNSGKVLDEDGNHLDIQALKVEYHINTPKQEIVDAWGRVIEMNKYYTKKDENGDIIKQKMTTRFGYDIMNNLLWVKDTKDRFVTQIKYDLLNNKSKISHIDAGDKTFFYNANGDVIETHNKNGSIQILNFDQLNRLLKIYGRDNENKNLILKEKYKYKNRRSTSSINKNLLGEVYEICDGAGKITFSSYDFKGNIKKKVRKFLKTSEILSEEISPFYIIDWENIGDNELESPGYSIKSKYDALNRLTELTYPDGIKIVFSYNKGKLLESVNVSDKKIIEKIIYNEKGLRKSIIYGNKIKTSYEYYPDSFHLKRCYTAGDLGDGSIYQDMNYKYDLIGNIISIKDNILGNLLGYDKEYTYDSFYRLVEVQEKECDDTSYALLEDKDQIQCSDKNKTHTYKRKYVFDEIGNIKNIYHEVDNHNIWEKEYIYELAHSLKKNNHIKKIKTNIGEKELENDESGNLIKINPNRAFFWDYKNQLRATKIKYNNSIQDFHSQYFYDSQGLRIKKVVKENDIIYENEYLDDFFEKHTSNPGDKVKKIKYIIIGGIRIAKIIEETPQIAHPITYLLTNHLGSVTISVNCSSFEKIENVNQEEYYPYGATAFGGIQGKKFRCWGKEVDNESGLYYFGTRYFAPSLCRWINPDNDLVENPNIPHTLFSEALVENPEISNRLNFSQEIMNFKTEDTYVNYFNAFRNNPINFIDLVGETSSRWDLIFEIINLLSGQPVEVKKPEIKNPVVIKETEGGTGPDPPKPRRQQKFRAPKRGVRGPRDISRTSQVPRRTPKQMRPRGFPRGQQGFATLRGLGAGLVYGYILSGIFDLFMAGTGLDLELREKYSDVLPLSRKQQRQLERMRSEREFNEAIEQYAAEHGISVEEILERAKEAAKTEPSYPTISADD